MQISSVLPTRRPLLAACLATLMVVGVSLFGLNLAASSASIIKVSKTPFVFGISYAESGPLAAQTYGTSQFIQAWFDYTDAHGGVQGHKVELDVLDDTGDAGKALLNVETLWSQDHVLGLIGTAGTFTPWAYIKQNNIPVWSLGGGTGSRGFGSYYSTWFPLGSVSPVWDSQSAYWTVKLQHKHPKVVAVLYNAPTAAWNSFIQNFWMKLGATTVYLDAGSGSPSTDCTALVLKWKSEGVQYIDEQDIQWVSCLEDEQTLGWRPPLGQGSEDTSLPGEANLLGRIIVGLVSGSPASLYTGYPIYSSPTEMDRIYEGSMKTYEPSFTNYLFLNDATTLGDYNAAVTVTTVLNLLLNEHKAVTSAHLVTAMQHLKNYSTFTLMPPVASFAPTCKTGGDGHTWGYWAYNAHPSASKPEIYMALNSGPNWVNTRKFLGLPTCYLTQTTNMLFPNG
jgi:hypothetical protein